MISLNLLSLACGQAAIYAEIFHRDREAVALLMLCAVILLCAQGIINAIKELKS